MQFRTAAAALQSRVSLGSYGDEELTAFWKLALNASFVLKASNSDLGMRVGLGAQFFSSVVRDRRRPKLESFLRALTAMIAVSDELLFDIDRANRISGGGSNQVMSGLRIEQHYNELLLMATSLGRIARGEIEKLDIECPNDPIAIERNKKERELLSIFANGFDRIAVALAVLSENAAEPVFLGKARSVVNSVGKQVNAWWGKNGAEAIDWSIRIPTFAAGVSMLGWAGANMTVATTAIAALVGGNKVIKAIRGRKKRK